MGNDRPNLQTMFPQEMQIAWSPVLNPLNPRGQARLLAKVVALISDRGKDHLRVALRINAGADTGYGERTLHQTIPDGEPVDKSAGRLVHINVGRYGLGIEVVQSRIGQQVWSEMETRTERLVGRQDLRKLGERVDRSRRGLVEGKRKRIHFTFVDGVFVVL